MLACRYLLYLSRNIPQTRNPINEVQTNVFVTILIQGVSCEKPMFRSSNFKWRLQDAHGISDKSSEDKEENRDEANRKGFHRIESFSRVCFRN